jgi:2-polyprenyl-3-methyl-5-hydroxy-6-metoxy-1,4-benzoquinol methylase
MNNFTEKSIREMSYTSFIAFINQTNVPPGAYSTLTKWRINSGMNSDSRVFEAACSTGFSLLNLVKNSNSCGVGVDISEPSIAAAKKMAVNMQLDNRTTFDCCDATTYQAQEKFSHIVVGAALGFFSNPAHMMKNILTMVDEYAYVLAAPFYAFKEVPTAVIEESRRILGITPTIQDYKKIMQLYHGFDVEYEDRLDSIAETEDEIKHYCESTINRACQNLNITDNFSYMLLYERLQEIKHICNKLREYQKYSVLVLKYNRGHYPNRYVEIF